MTLYVLDTDHLSLYQRDVEPLTSKLLAIEHSPDELAITIVTVEEQLRGRLVQVKKATTTARLAEAYHWLHETFDQLSRLPVLNLTTPQRTFTTICSPRSYGSARRTCASRQSYSVGAACC